MTLQIVEFISDSPVTIRDPHLISDYLASQPETEKVLLGYSRDELIIDCQFAGSSCTVDNFTWSYNPTLGNCYTFNSGWDPRQSVFTSRVAGYRYGEVIFD